MRAQTSTVSIWKVRILHELNTTGLFLVNCGISWYFTNPKWHGAPHPLVRWLRGHFDMLQCHQFPPKMQVDFTPEVFREVPPIPAKVAQKYANIARTRISGGIFLVRQGWAVLQVHLSFIATVDLTSRAQSATASAGAEALRLGPGDPAISTPNTMPGRPSEVEERMSPRSPRLSVFKSFTCLKPKNAKNIQENPRIC